MKHLSALLRILNEVNEMYIYEYVEVGLSNFLSTNSHRLLMITHQKAGATWDRYQTVLEDTAN